MIGRDEEKYQKEADIEESLVTYFKDRKTLYFIAISSQNIDRLVSVYRACVRTGRIFVLDPYTAYILDKLKSISSNIPQFNWGKNIRIFFVPNSYTEKMAKDKSLFKYASAKISFDEMTDIKDKIVVKDTYLTRRIFAKKTYWRIPGLYSRCGADTYLR
jgi:ribonuclease J